MAVRTRRYGEILEWQWKSDAFLANPPKWTSSYLLDGLLIDTGCPAGSRDIVAWAQSLPSGQKIHKVFLTHFHEDHAGGAFAIQKALGLSIFAPELTQELLDAQKKYKYYRKVYWGAHNHAPIKLIPVGNTIESATGAFHFEVIPLPGHSPDLHALFDRHHQLMFVGDALVTRYLRIFGGNCPDIQESMEQIYLSQKKLYEITAPFPDVQIMVSHSGMFPRAFIKEKMEEIDRLHRKVHEIAQTIPNFEHHSKSKQIAEITGKVWPEGEDRYMKLMTRGELCRGNLVASLLKWKL